MNRYRIAQPTSPMHNWIVDGEITMHEKYEIEYVLFFRNNQGYGVPLNWCETTDKQKNARTTTSQTEMAL